MDEITRWKATPGSDISASLLEVRYEENPYDESCMDNESLVVIHRGIVIARQSDGGESEDNFFSRDYAWIKPLLEQVYALGVADKRDGLIP